VPLSTSYIGKASRHGFILGFGSTEVENIPNAVRKLRTILSSNWLSLRGDLLSDENRRHRLEKSLSFLSADTAYGELWLSLRRYNHTCVAYTRMI